MRKRKPPVFLATVLVLMLVAVGIMYAPRGADDGHGHNQQAANTPPPPAAEKGERPKISASQVVGLAKGAMANSDKGGRPGPDGPAGPATGPSVAAIKPQAYKPTPNESSTSTQWYTDQTKK